MSFRITKDFYFDAAHRLPHVPVGHKCGRLHGHGYRVTLGIEGDLDPALGWVMDFGAIKAAFASLLERLDHMCLNDLPGLENPTAELLAAYIFKELQPALPLLSDVTVCESSTNAATYRPGK